MIILHAGMLNRELFLWAESSAQRKPLPAKSGRRLNLPKPLSYPFDGGFNGLTTALGEAGVEFKPVKNSTVQAAVWLPTRGSKPIPSSPLIAEPPPSRAKLILSPWVVTSFPLNEEQTLEFLCRCMDKHTLVPGVVIGKDLAFWTEALRFTGSIVSRQRFLPGLKSDANGYRARWEPVFSGNDVKLLADLTKRMPPVTMALSKPDATSPPQMVSSAVLRAFVEKFTDRLVRSACQVSFKPARKTAKKKTNFDSVHDAWIRALKTTDGTITAKPEELALLEQQIQEWRRPLAMTAASPFRLCFRLEEPESPNETVSKGKQHAPGNWYVRYLVQPHEDPSLLVPVEDVWDSRSHKMSALKKYGSHVREYLLSALGQAAGICPHTASSLENARPAGYDLNTKEAHKFLTEVSMALEQAGFGVLLPAWWTRKGTKQRLSVRAVVKTPKMQGGSGLSMGSIIQFNWKVALGGKTLTLRELEQLAKLKAPLVRIRGQWVEMNSSEIRKAVEFWKNKPPEKLTFRDLIQMAIGVKDPGIGFEFSGIKAAGWINKFMKQLDGRARLDELETPQKFSGTLRPYQVRGYSWLSFLHQWGLGGCLADDMGLGKTIQTLVLIQRDWEKNTSKRNRRPVLLICPTSVVNNWVKEAARFTPNLPVMVHHGVGRKKQTAFKKEAAAHAMVISSYSLLHRDISFLREVKWAGVVLDEAQFIKNPETKQSRAARSINSDYRIALTGTPVENNVGDLWSIMEFLNPGFLGTQASFKRNFFVPIQARRDPEATARLKKITGPFILRRLKTDKSIISDLPEKMEMKVFCTLTKEQASLYAAVVEEMEKTLNSAEGIQRKGMILGTLSKLKQVCNHPAQFLGDNSAIAGRSGKLSRLTEMLEEINQIGEKALVFSQFAEMGFILKNYLQELLGEKVLFLHGGVPKKKRDWMVERFQQKGDGPPVFVLSLRAGGTGLNLTSANHVFHFDRWWNPAVENQATDRTFRIGQTKNVQVHKFICAGTLEDKIDEMIERKKAIAEDVVGTGESWLTELSNEEIKEVFALRKEAVGD